MFDYTAAREHMVESQIRTSDVTDYGVLNAFRTTHRELFVPKTSKALAYSDANIALENERVLMKPRDMSKMIQAADIQPTNIVLDIACGRGYSSAILAKLAETVVALEETDEAVEKATTVLSESGADNAVVVKGNIKSGAREHGPFDVIFVNGAVAEVPSTWFDQLANNGRLVAVIKNGPIGRATLFTRSGDTIGDKIIFDASVPFLPGTQKPAVFAL